jgi:uncharacterized repeat protein (TIGR01451 family)
MNPHHRSHRMRRLVGALVLVASLLALAAARGSALASVGGWTIDGTVPDAGAVQFTDPYGSVSELGPVNSSATKLVSISSATPPMLDMTDPNPQTDLKNVWLGMKTSGGDAWLYLAWERDSATGSGMIMFEFDKASAPAACDYSKDDATLIADCNPWANRSAGDFVLIWDQHGQTIDIIKRTFVESGGSLTLGPGTVLDSTVSAAAASADGFRGEAAVDLSKTVFSEVTNCETFANVIPGTVTGNSDTADFKDTVLANFGDKVFLSSCGAIKVTKATVPATAPAASFPYTVGQADQGALRFGDGATPSLSGTLTHGGDFDLLADLRADTDYQLAEDLSQATIDAGWTKDSIVCSLGGTDYPISGTATFPVAVSMQTTCTITNSYVRPTGTLIVEKVVVNDNGGTKTAADFSFVVGDGSPVAFEADGSNSLTLDAGTYSVTEPAVAGYTTTYDGCSAIALANGETKTCTITNDDRPATLTVVKHVVNDNGGTAKAGDFTLTVTGTKPAPASFPGSETGTTVTLWPGAYTVTENGPGGYIGTPSSDCTGTIALGEAKTCTFLNEDVTPPPPPPPVVDLSITKVDSPDPVERNAQLTYTIVVTNKVLSGSSFSASNVTVGDPAPSGVVFVSATSTAGTCTVDASGLSCKLGTIVAGGSVTITVTARPQVVGTVTNTAVVVSTERDVNPADNQATATTQVIGPFTPPAICAKVQIRPITISVGKRTVVVVLVRDQRGKALPKATVNVRGPGIAVVGLTDRTGTYKRALTPKRAGIVRVQVPGSSTCVARFGVVGVFQPPVTG